MVEISGSRLPVRKAARSTPEMLLNRWYRLGGRHPPGYALLMKWHKRPGSLGIDLGTANTIAVTKQGGVVFEEPSITCFQAYDAAPRFVAGGAVASAYVGRVVKPLKIVRPLRDGVLSDMLAARELLRLVRERVMAGRRFGRLKPFIGVPADATESERRALMNAAKDAGFDDPSLVSEPFLAALGLGLDVYAPRGRMIIDCGAGTTEVAVISLGQICTARSVRGGGEALNQALVDYLNFKHHFQIGPAAAEALKVELSSLFETGEAAAVVNVSGLDNLTGLPRTIEIPAEEFRPAWLKHISQIVEIIREAMLDTNPELCRDILEDGIILTGGGSLGALLAQQIESETGVATSVSDAPRHCVTRGLQRLITEQSL